VYPVKSCAGVEVQEAILTETGLDWDRAWMVVDEHGEFVSQRELPRMALITPKLRLSDVVLRAPGMLALHLAMDAVEEPTRKCACGTTKWMPTTWAAWPRSGSVTFLGQKLRLVRFDPQVRRLSSLKWTGGVEAPNQFSDGFPCWWPARHRWTSSTNGWRPPATPPWAWSAFGPTWCWRVWRPMTRTGWPCCTLPPARAKRSCKPVKPCARCPIPNVDPATAESSPEVGDTLQGYRQDARLNGAVTFGMNAIVLAGDGLVLRTGQAGDGQLQLRLSLRGLAALSLPRGSSLSVPSSTRAIVQRHALRGLGLQEADRPPRAWRHALEQVRQRFGEFRGIHAALVQEHGGNVELQRHFRLQALQRHQARGNQPCRPVGDGRARCDAFQDQAKACFAHAAGRVHITQQAAQLDHAAQQALLGNRMRRGSS
jgi:uncharacterized protein YcbX